MGVVALVGATVAVTPAKAQDDGEAVSDSTPANIEKRLRQIEDSIIDMRAMIGALQSFAPGASGAESPARAAPDDGLSTDPYAESGNDLFGQSDAVTGDAVSGDAAPASGPDSQLDQLEIQVQALAAQLSEVVRRLDRMEAATGALPQGASESDEAGTASAPPSFGADTADQQTAQADPQADSGFGATTVQDPVAPEDDGAASWPDDTITARVDEAASPDAQAMFTQAYDALQAEDYAAARDGFNTFLETYADDPLVNEARYWLADASFAMGEYVDAANNFVKVYNTAPRGDKAEDTLLKLAIALRRLDRPESACDALNRLDGRLEDKPARFRKRVADERSRSGCG